MEANLWLSGDLMRLNYQQAPYSMQVPETLPLQVGCKRNLDQPSLLFDGSIGKSFDNVSGNGQWMNSLCALDGQNDVGAEKREPVWRRIKWTDTMVKLLINVVSFVEEDASSAANNQERKNLFLFPMKGKWRTISNIMNETGYIVSPQQCEDKFNDLSKKYRRLKEILGRKTCLVVENPVLLESIIIPDEVKEEVKKILSCRQLSYREMCSYHNRNRNFIPRDKGLQYSVHSATNVGCESLDVSQAVTAKKQKLQKDHGVVNLDGPSNHVDLTGSVPQAPKDLVNVSSVLPQDVEAERDLNQMFISHTVQLKRQEMELEREMVKLEKEKIVWLKKCQKEDEKLSNMKREIELMKLENKRLAFELKYLEMGAANCK